MKGVFSAGRASGIADGDMQTGNLSLNPVHDYPNNARPRLTGYQASNQITVKVRKLDTLGKTLDAVVKAGGNTINRVTFSIDRPEKLVSSTDRRNTYLTLRMWSESHEAEVLYCSRARRGLGTLEERRRADRDRPRIG